MAVVQPPCTNQSEHHYEDYGQHFDALEVFRPCEKHQVKRFSRLFLPVFYSVACGLGLLANFALIGVFIRNKSVRRAHPLCVACADLLFTITLPFRAVHAARDWVFGTHACKVVTLVHVVGLYSSNLFVACVVLQGYVDGACVFRCLGRVGASKKNAVSCASVWLLSCLAAAPHLSFVETCHFHGETICTYHFAHEHGWRVYLRFQLVALGFCAPFLVALCASLAIRVHADSIVSVRSRTLRRAMAFTGLLFMLWFPYAVVSVLHALQELHVISECNTSVHLDLAIQTTECIAFAHVFLNPVAYVLLNRRAWRALTGGCTGSRRYLLGASESADNVSSQDSAVELRALQSFSNPENERG